MRRLLLILLTTCFISAGKAQNPLWQVGTALTLPKGWFDKGVFQPLRYGLTTSTELSTYPVIMAFMPNLALKHRWYISRTEWFISTKHGVYYPSMLLKRVAGNGSINLLPARSEVPFLLPTYHEFLASKYLIPKTVCDQPDLLLTLKLGATLTMGKATEEKMSTIDYPLIFHPTQTYYGKFFWYAGADLEGHFNEWINFSVDLEFQSVKALEFWTLSHKGLLVWPWTSRWTLAGGYRLHYGTYPFGNKFKVIPQIDVSYKFRFKRKSKMQYGLFGQDDFKYDKFQEKKHKIEQDEFEEFYEEVPRDQDDPQNKPIPKENP